MAPVVCLDSPVNTCKQAATCPTLEFWEGFYRHTTQYLNGTTLHDLVKKSDEKAGWEYNI